MPSKQEHHIQITADKSLALDYLVDASGLSRQQLKSAMQKGCVWLEKDNYTQRLRRAKKTLSAGDTLHFYYDPAILQAEPLEATLITDQGDYSIWDKPSGMLSQGSKWGDHCTIYRWAEKHLKPERAAFIVHRLDRAASGLMILAHKKKVAAQFSSMFQHRKIEKRYHAFVEGDFSKLIKDKESSKTISTDIDNKNAISHVRLIKYDKDRNESQLEVQIETGRKHQIRKHLSELGFAVIGDRLYGSDKSKKNLQLKAVLLTFSDPISGEIQNFRI